MATQGAVPAAPAPADRPRPDVLAYPSPTTWRFLVFLAALLSAGVFVGNWVHNQVHYREWLAVVVRCNNEALTQPGAVGPSVSAGIARERAASRCRGAADRRWAAYAVGGAAAAGAAGLVVLYLVPGVVERRRRLRPILPELRPAAERVATLASEAGLGRAPAVVLGDAALRDGFSYGTPGRYRIALPRGVAVRWRHVSLFDPLVRHELAHVAHRDVALAWLARSVWYALAPLLAVPLVAALFSDDRSLVPDYLWRTVLFAVMVQLVSTALLRSREHDADLRAAKAGGPEAVAALLDRVPDRGTAPWYRRLVANHPTPARRRAVLERPELAAGVTFLDGFTAAFLATLTVPLVSFTLVAFLMGSGRSDLARFVAALVAGPLLGGAVGLGLWRAALVQRVARGTTARPVTVAVGVAAGLVTGQVASFAQTGTAAIGGVTHPQMLALVALAGLGGTAVAAGLGELWANAAPAVRRARDSWVVALAVNSVLFTAVLWVARSLEVAFEFNWAAARAWLVTAVADWPTLGAVAVLAATAAWALRRSRRHAETPPWLLEAGTPGPWPEPAGPGLAGTAGTAVAAGLVGAAAIIGFRVVSGPAASDAALVQRYFTYLWVAAAAGAAAVLALALLAPRRGVGAGALAGPLASLVAVAGLLAMNAAIGGGLQPGFVATTAKTPLALGLVLALLAAPAGLLVWQWERHRRRAWPAAAALGLVAVLAVYAGRGTLTSLVSEETPVPGGKDQDAVLVAEALHYLSVVAPDALRRHQAVQAAWRAVVADQTATDQERAGRVRAEVLAPLRDLLADMQAYRPATPETRSVHQELVAALRAGTEGFETVAAALAAGDASLLPAAEASWQEELRRFQAWGSGLDDLRASAGLG